MVDQFILVLIFLRWKGSGADDKETLHQPKILFNAAMSTAGATGDSAIAWKYKFRRINIKAVAQGIPYDRCNFRSWYIIPCVEIYLIYP